jgi:hypothetical protein
VQVARMVEFFSSAGRQRKRMLAVPVCTFQQPPSSGEFVSFTQWSLSGHSGTHTP